MNQSLVDMRRNVSRSGLARKHRSQRYAVKNWVNRLADVPCFIIGNAPSVLDHDLTSLNNYFTIGINRAFQLIDPTILMWQDLSLWKSEFHDVHNLQALKVARDVADPRRLYYNFCLKGGNYQFSPDKSHVLYGRGSSGPLAAQFAVALGCRPLILLGCDCKRGSDGRGDFYGENKFWLPHTLDNCWLGLEFLKKECPVEIISCGNAEELWPRQELKDVLRDRINPRYAIGRQEYVKILKS